MRQTTSPRVIIVIIALELMMPWLFILSVNGIFLGGSLCSVHHLCNFEYALIRH